MKITFSKVIKVDVCNMLGEFIQTDDKAYMVESTEHAFDEEGVTTKSIVLEEVDIPWPRILDQ